MTPAAAVVDVPAEPDSLQPRSASPIDHYGAGTNWMIGMTLVEQGDLTGSLPYLMQAWRLSPDEPEMAAIYRDVLLELGYGGEAREVSRHLLARGHGSLANRERHTIIMVALESYEEALTTLQLLQAEFPDTVRFSQMEAEILLRSGRYDEAADRYRELRHKSPDQDDVLTATLAEIALRRDDHDEARREWTEGLARHPGSSMLRSGWIRFAVSRSWDDQAFLAAVDGDALGEATVMQEDLSWIRMTSGLIIASGRGDDAFDWLMARVQSDELDVEDRLFLCRLLASRDQPAIALGLLEDIVERWPNHAVAWMFLGEFSGAVENLEQAETAARRARFLAPDDPDILFSLMAILARRHPEAFAKESRSVMGDSIRIEILDIAEDLEESSATFTANSRMLLATTYHSLRQHDHAIRHYELAAEDPSMARDALLNLSLVYEQTDRDEDMIAALERLFLAMPDDPVVQNALGYSLADFGIQLDRAEALIRRALTVEPDNPAFLDSLGWLFFRRGQPVESFDYLVRAANALPDDPVILEHLSRALQAMGQQERSVHVARQALEAGGNLHDLADLLDGDGP